MAGTGTAHLRNDVVLSVTELVVEFPARKKQVVHAVSGVSFDLDKGETLGIVGESGCGKTTTGRAIMQLESRRRRRRMGRRGHGVGRVGRRRCCRSQAA